MTSMRYFLLACCLLMSHSASNAATITVNTTADTLLDDGLCSLREAVFAANTNAAFRGCPAGQADPVIDTIVLSALRYDLTLGDSGDDTNLEGDLDITESVVIEGAVPIDALQFSDFTPLDEGNRPVALTQFALDAEFDIEPSDETALKANILRGVDAVISPLLTGNTVVSNGIGDPNVDGDGDRVFEIDPLQVGGMQVTFRNLIITAGDVACTGEDCDTGGGAIHAFGTDMTLEFSLITGNTSSCFGFACGSEGIIPGPDRVSVDHSGSAGIYTLEATNLNLLNTAFIGNRTECRVDGCSVGHGVLDAEEGAGVITIENTVVSGNLILCEGVECEVEELFSTDGEPSGAATIDNFFITHNMIFCEGFDCQTDELLELDQFTSQTIEDTFIKWNLLECQGEDCDTDEIIDGGVVNSIDTGKIFEIKDSEISFNALLCSGINCDTDEVVDEDFSTATNLRLEQNILHCSGDSCDADEHYNVDADGSEHNNLVFLNNRSSCSGINCDTGDILDFGGNDMVINQSLVQGNISECRGEKCTANSIMSIRENRALISNSRIINNRSSCTGADCIIIGGCQIDLSAEPPEPFCVTNSGGAVAILNDNVIIQDTLIQGNFSDGEGAGISLQSSNDFADALTILRSRIEGNTSSTNGGGISVIGELDRETGELDDGGASLIVIESSIIGNQASGNGGGIYGFEMSDIAITNSTMSKNTALGEGGGIFSEGASLNLLHTTTADNSGATVGGLFAEAPLAAIITNSILADSQNGADCIANDSATVTPDAGTIIEDASCSALVSGDPGLLALDFLSSHRAHALASDSSARGAGVLIDCADNDQRGQIRQANDTGCDTGAIEYNSSDGVNFIVIPASNGAVIVAPL